MNIVLSRALLVGGSYVMAYYLASYFGVAYGTIFPEALGGGSFIPTSAAQWFAGLPLSVVFFVILFQMALGKKNVWWWIGIALVPAILFEVLLDPLHIYIPIVLGLMAWGLGKLANKMLWRFAPEVMAKLSG